MIGDKEVAVCADMFAKEAKGDIVTRETRASEAETASEILASDTSVRADGVADDIYITAGTARKDPRGCWRRRSSW